MSATANITEKKYKKLVLKVSLTGFSYCIFDTISNRALSLKQIDFRDYPATSKVEDHYWSAFLDHPALTKSYDEIVVYHDNNLNTFVPQELFDEDYLGSYLQYNTKVFETDYFEYDEIATYEMHNVYIPYVNINNFLIDQFGSFYYKNVNTVLVKSLLDLSKNNDERQIFVYVSERQFEIVAVQNQKLLLFNSFEYSTREDFLYYLLFAAEQLDLNPEYFKLQLLGNISEESELYKIAYKYVRNVALADVTDLQKLNDFPTDENLKHFIILQS
ncbi:MAG: DUF3822 family protein [Flavobacterium sp.]|nr:DUF3822 family protein [Flavobacterium sp.]